MSLAMQVIGGSGLLVVCALVHVATVAVSIPMTRRLHDRLATRRAGARMVGLLSFGVVITLFAHMIQVWSWAVAIHALSEFRDFPVSFYFALATYTTVGYGDVIVGDGLRIFAAFASVAGLLTFGISTAYLISLIGRLLPASIGEDGPDLSG